MYKIIFDKKAINFLNKIEKELRKRIWNKIQKCKEDPFQFLEHLEGMEGYKLRIGDYRAVIDVNNTKKVLEVLKIGHRKNVYQK